MSKAIEIPAEVERKMPKTVPVLTAGDMHLNAFDSPCGKRHCLVGWLREVFGSMDSKLREYSDAFLKAELGADTLRDVTAYNDLHATKAQAALTFNRAMEAMGYTEDC